RAPPAVGASATAGRQAIDRQTLLTTDPRVRGRQAIVGAGGQRLELTEAEAGPATIRLCLQIPAIGSPLSGSAAHSSPRPDSDRCRQADTDHTPVWPSKS